MQVADALCNSLQHYQDRQLRADAFTSHVSGLARLPLYYRWPTGNAADTEYDQQPPAEFGDRFFLWVSRISQVVVLGGVLGTCRGATAPEELAFMNGIPPWLTSVDRLHTPVLAICIATPETVGNMMQDYKLRLERRRKDKIIDTISGVKLFLEEPNSEHQSDTAASKKGKTKHGHARVALKNFVFPEKDKEKDKPQVLDEILQEEGKPPKEDDLSMLDVDGIYHHQIAHDMETALVRTPIRRYAVLMGGRGSGKTQLLKRIANGKPYVAYMTFDLVSSVDSMVDLFAEEVGFDFDDWTERLLSSYIFKTALSKHMTPLDRLSFLLDEIEEACLNLKFDPQNRESKHRPLFIFEDVNKFDVSDVTSRKAVQMLFNAASKWASEDTALVLFTVSNKMFAQEYGKLIKRDVLEHAKVYSINHLAPKEAAHFLTNNMHPAPSPEETSNIISRLGTRINDLRRLAEERTRNPKSPLPKLINEEISDAADEITRVLSAVEVSTPYNPSHQAYNTATPCCPNHTSYPPPMTSTMNGKEKVAAAVKFLDMIERDGCVSMEVARGLGVADVIGVLVEEDVVAYKGLAGVEFGSKRMEEGWRKWKMHERFKWWMAWVGWR
ncbi:hypothetical protein HDV00_012800 [Rhizophlyctis rosea]|nr:hypothetical protein HDV00_012800 [Rhizophlyctis rosea]